MQRRKRIGVIITNPEAAYSHRILSGLEEQSARYGYDLVVFSPLVSMGIPQKDYVAAELNILNIINFDLLDGVVVCARSFLTNGDKSIIHSIEALLRKKCKVPVVSIDYHLDFPSEPIFMDGGDEFAQIADHIFGYHKCRNAIFLCGSEGNHSIKYLLDGILKKAKKYGIPKEDVQVVYGDFWYTSGTKLAQRILSGEVKLPDAVICQNDYMALGLESTLRKGGIKAPDDLIITGYDATMDAALNEVTITSYMPRLRRLAMEGVNALFKKIEPEGKVIPVKIKDEPGLVCGSSCGCNIDYSLYRNAINQCIYKVNRSEDEWNKRENFDFGRLMESYMFEELTEQNNPLECIRRIFVDAYLLEPYSCFYLCLNEDWLDTGITEKTEYTNKIIMATNKISKENPMYKQNANVYSLDVKNGFRKRQMLPQLDSEWPGPQSFFFVPLHFVKNTFGYVVIQFDSEKGLHPTLMHRNWLRNVQNALEMVRTKNSLYSQTVVDELTGIYNRNKFKEFVENKNNLNILDNAGIMMLDIDFFKHINDTYGHDEGDLVLKHIAELAKSCIRSSDVLIRWGGEEFLIVCPNCSSKTRLMEIGEKIRKTVEEDNSMIDLLTVSIGISVSKNETVERAIKKADLALYYAKKHGRNQVIMFGQIPKP